MTIVPAVSRRTLLAGGATAGALALLAACSSGTAAKSAASASTSAGTGGSGLVIGLTYTPTVQFAPFYMALADGKYASGVSLRHHGAQEGQFDALLAGTEQLVVAGADEAAVAASNGNGVVAVGGFYQAYPGCVIVPEISDITTLADLKGRTIGTPGRTGETWYTLEVALKTAGLTEDDVTIQEIGFTQQAALVGGKVDAIVGYSNNDAVQIAQNGTKVRTIAAAADVPLVGASLVTTRDYLAAHREELADAVTASAAGMALFVDDPDGAVTATKKYVTDLADSTQAANAREVAVATGKLIRPEDSTVVGSLRSEEVAAMITFLGGQGLLGSTSLTADDVCDPLLSA